MAMISKQEWLSTETPVVVFEPAIAMKRSVQSNSDTIVGTISGADFNGTLEPNSNPIGFFQRDFGGDNSVRWRAPDGTFGDSALFIQDVDTGLLLWTMTQPYQQGRWDIILNRSFDGSSWWGAGCIYWGVNETALVAGTLAQSLLQNSVFFDGATSKLNLYASNGVAVVGHWLCYRADGVTLATAISQVAKRGPFVLGA
jgi:hypothetical protein